MAGSIRYDIAKKIFRQIAAPPVGLRFSPSRRLYFIFEPTHLGIGIEPTWCAVVSRIPACRPYPNPNASFGGSAMRTTTTLENIVTTTPFFESSALPAARFPAWSGRAGPLSSSTRRAGVFPLDECEAWLQEHGYLVDPYRAAIKKLVDAAPPLTAERAANFRTILGGAARSRHQSLTIFDAEWGPDRPDNCRSRQIVTSEGLGRFA